ncbi:MAG TPA: thioredoxin domain-containing protein [Vitreimonas sp.]|uniref:thioredoxin domain-containing protein n=1 Tax=Vitreimonas sp. TaxID=3069702 RepID=UPI002D3160A9|nr:thioredoxin domain-containing protein [Vitreimonas sp.]HYD86754.1 thioredoxin domain-containing protein [Vitreimonas sp.]
MIIDRRGLLVGAAALAASPAHAQSAPAEMTIGAAQAPLHLVEYASSTCGHCAHFHETNWARLKSGYIDAGRVRFTMREMATPPPQVAFGMFQLARCGNAASDEYFRRLGVLFQRQRTILQSGSMAAVRDALVAIGAEWGLSAAQVIASLQDGDGAARLSRSIDEANRRGVHSTPTFFLNGAAVDPSFQSLAGMTAILDAAV